MERSNTFLKQYNTTTRKNGKNGKNHPCLAKHVGRNQTAPVDLGAQYVSKKIRREKEKDMTNCFFVTIKGAFKPQDFYAHFPKYQGEELPLDLFVPYFQNLHNLASFLFQLTQIFTSMYGYEKINDGSAYEQNKGKIMYYLSSHVLVNGDRVEDRDLGEWVQRFVTKELNFETMLKNGYYDGCGTFDPILVMLCEFTGIEIHAQMLAYSQRLEFPREPHKNKTVQIPTKTFVYKRLNTLVQTKVFIQVNKKHIQCLKRQDMPNKNPKKRKLI